MRLQLINISSIVLCIVCYVSCSGNSFLNTDIDLDRLAHFTKAHRILCGEEPSPHAYTPLPTKRELQAMKAKNDESNRKERQNALEKIKASFKKRKG